MKNVYLVAASTGAYDLDVIIFISETREEALNKVDNLDKSKYPEDYTFEIIEAEIGKEYYHGI